MLDDLPSPAELPKEIWERKKIGIDLRQKFELYFVSLIFTLLALSVQTAKPSANILLSVCEITGWVMLLTAGLMGLWRINNLWLRELWVADYQEKTWGSSGLPEIESQIHDQEKKIRTSGKLQFWLFMLGLASLMFSRAVQLFAH